MASYLQIENISKSYGIKTLFENIGFNINEGDKIALIAPNGTGKTSLLKILAGKDKSDSDGKIIFLKDIRIAFLEQEYRFDGEKTIKEQIFHSLNRQIQYDENSHAFEVNLNKILSNLGLSDPETKMKNLSGGEVKRVAIAQMMSLNADFYIMDEPTNHLDTDAIEFLEKFFKKERCTLLMVTHDRYFLDKVCNTIIELDKGKLYTYKGNYQTYLEKRAERIENHNAETERIKNLYRKELEWMRSTPCARTGKAKYRKEAFYRLRDRASEQYTIEKTNMDGIGNESVRGSKVINCKHLSFYYGNDCYLDNFTYNFGRNEKIGIVGKNGVGKSTFINILTNRLNGEGRIEGEIERGESINIGYYHQKGLMTEEGQTVSEVVNDPGLLTKFLFPYPTHNSKISTLSGGEKRRLYLLSVLMKNPNVLILDEPTNDLDIVTLNILEEYLKNYKGTLIIVSHDRHFVDKLADHLFIFCGKGIVKDFIGSYSEYREYIKEAEKKESAEKKKENQSSQKPVREKNGNKLTYKEKIELKEIETRLESLQQELESIHNLLKNCTDYKEIEKNSIQYRDIKEEADKLEIRWLELAEKNT